MSSSTRAASPTRAAKVGLRPSPAASPSLADCGGGGSVGSPVGVSVTGRQVCPAEEQSPSEQRCVPAQLQRYAAGENRRGVQTPNSVESQPWVPSSQACRVGLWVGVALGAEVVGALVGAMLVGMPVGAGVGSDPVVGASEGITVGSDEVGPDVVGPGVGSDVVGGVEGVAVGSEVAGEVVGSEVVGTVVNGVGTGVAGEALGTVMGTEVAGEVVGSEVVGTGVAGEVVGSEVVGTEATGGGVVGEPVGVWQEWPQHPVQFWTSGGESQHCSGRLKELQNPASDTAHGIGEGRRGWWSARWSVRWSDVASAVDSHDCRSHSYSCHNDGNGTNRSGGGFGSTWPGPDRPGGRMPAPGLQATRLFA